jgi:hypothetical protein
VNGWRVLGTDRLKKSLLERSGFCAQGDELSSRGLHLLSIAYHCELPAACRVLNVQVTFAGWAAVRCSGPSCSVHLAWSSLRVFVVVRNLMVRLAL